MNLLWKLLFTTETINHHNYDYYNIFVDKIVRKQVKSYTTLSRESLAILNFAEFSNVQSELKSEFSWQMHLLNLTKVDAIKVLTPQGNRRI